MDQSAPTANVSEIPGIPPHDALLNSLISIRGAPPVVLRVMISIPGFCHAARSTTWCQTFSCITPMTRKITHDYRVGCNKEAGTDKIQSNYFEDNVAAYVNFRSAPYAHFNKATYVMYFRTLVKFDRYPWSSNVAKSCILRWAIMP